ncbi:BGTF surface domain-containing protein [Halorubrum sp. F4]|uniref:BGTF surface domain-containing protein n=1 Tax=Halorubrum sp. F4 TaxID=2989715 RepID=UPI0024808B42|nr:BGTF surface domain-containing protein [Halorubrum sp. F4]
MTADGAASSGSVVVGGQDDFGYQANVTITDFGDDDEVTLKFNTYSAGTGQNAVSLVDTDDDDDEISVDPDSNLNDILEQGDYDISSSVDTDPAETLENPDDVATLFIDERSTDGIQVWTASDSNADDITSADDDEKLDEIESAVEDDELTQTSSVAHNDVSVHQLSASGLTGLLDYAAAVDGSIGEDDKAEQLGYLVDNNGTDNYADGDKHVRFRLRETRASAGPNADRITVPVNASVIDDVVVDEENDEYYVFVDTTSLDLATDEDYEFDVQFRVQDERLVDPDDEDISTDSEYRALYQQVSAQFDVEERDASFDADPYNVTPTDSEEVTGTTNVAPGTEFTVRARSKTGTQPSFVKTNDEINVTTDGAWSTTFDFSEQNVGDEYTLRISQLGLSDTEEVDGTVVEEPEEPANFAVSDLSAPGSVTQGDVIDVSATIENTGEATATQTVEFQIEGDTVLDQDIELSGGESTTVEYTDVDTSSLDPGDYEHGVFTNDDSQTATLTVEEASDDGSEDDSSDDSTDDSSDDDSTDDSSDDSTDDSSDDSSDDSTDDSTDDDSTDDSTPGFGALVALVALIAAALLATRRRD